MACARRLFPDPLLPTTATISPSRTVTFRSRITGSSPCFALRFSYCAKDTVRCSMRSNSFFSSIVFSTQNLLQLRTRRVKQRL